MSTPGSPHRSIIAEQMQRRRKPRSLLNPNRVSRRRRAGREHVAPPATPPPPHARVRKRHEGRTDAPSSGGRHRRDHQRHGRGDGDHAANNNSPRDGAAPPSTPSQHNGPPAPLRLQLPTPNGSPQGTSTPKRVSFNFSGGNLSDPGTPTGDAASVASAATMSEAEMQARLDQVRQASMRQFQSMRDLHGRDVDRLRRELESQHKAALKAKDRELAEQKAFYEQKLAEDVARAEDTWKQRLEAMSAMHEATNAELTRKLQEEREAHTRSRQAWEKEKAKIMEEAESGFVSLYSDVTTNAETLVTNMRQQMREVVERASRESQLAHEKSLQEVQQATTSRIEFEERMSKECEVLIKEYQQLAERAMKKAAEAREAAQVDMLNRLREQEADRRRWEATIQKRTDAAIAAADKRAAAAREELQQERQRFVLLEAEVRKQFESHCKEFERRMRNKAAVTLTQYKVHLESERRMALALADTTRADNHGGSTENGRSVGQSMASSASSGPRHADEAGSRSASPSPASSHRGHDQHGDHRHGNGGRHRTTGGRGDPRAGSDSDSDSEAAATSSPAPLTDAMKAFQRAQTAVREATAHYDSPYRQHPADDGSRASTMHGRDFVSVVSDPTVGDAASSRSVGALSHDYDRDGDRDRDRDRDHDRSHDRPATSSVVSTSSRSSQRRESPPFVSRHELGAGPKEQPTSTQAPTRAPPPSPPRSSGAGEPGTTPPPAVGRTTSPRGGNRGRSPRSPANHSSGATNSNAEGQAGSRGDSEGDAGGVPRAAGVRSSFTRVASSPQRSPGNHSRSHADGGESTPAAASGGGSLEELDVTTPEGLNAYIRRLRDTSATAASLASSREAAAKTARALETHTSPRKDTPPAAPVVPPADLMKQYQQAYAAVKRQRSRTSRGTAVSPRYDHRSSVQAVSPAVAPSPGSDGGHRPFTDGGHHRDLATGGGAAAGTSKQQRHGVPNRPPPLPPPAEGNGGGGGGTSGAGGLGVGSLAGVAASAAPRGLSVGDDDDDALAAVVEMMSEEDRRAWQMLQSMY